MTVGDALFALAIYYGEAVRLWASLRAARSLDDLVSHETLVCNADNARGLLALAREHGCERGVRDGLRAGVRLRRREEARS